MEEAWRAAAISFSNDEIAFPQALGFIVTSGHRSGPAAAGGSIFKTVI
jgi:hypothetical protein